MQYGYKLTENFENINKIQIDNSKILILTDVYISYDKASKNVEHYTMSGYLLEK